MCRHRDFGWLFLVRNLRWSFLLAVVGLTILADVRAHARAWTIETIPTLHSIQSIQQTEQSEQDWIAAGTPFSLIAASTFVGKVVAAVRVKAVSHPVRHNLERAPPSQSFT
jgi:hypothetical protein